MKNEEIEDITEELNRDIAQKRKDEIVLAELQKQATGLLEVSLANELKKSKKKYKTKVGFLLQGLFGKKRDDGEGLWILKDLRPDQLLSLIEHLSNKKSKISNCCGAPLQKGEIETPNYKYQFDKTLPPTKMAIRNFCSKCGERNIKKS